MDDRFEGQPPLDGDLFEDQGFVDPEGIPLRWKLVPAAWHPFWTDSVLNARANLVRQVARWRELRSSGLVPEGGSPRADASKTSGPTRPLRDSTRVADGADFEHALIEWWSTARESRQGGWDYPSWEQWKESAHEDLEHLLQEIHPDQTIWPVLDRFFGSLELVDRFMVLGKLLTTWASAVPHVPHADGFPPAADPSSRWIAPWLLRWHALWQDAQNPEIEREALSVVSGTRGLRVSEGGGRRTIWSHSFLTWQSLLQEVSAVLPHLPVTAWGIEPERVAGQSHFRVWGEVVEVLLAHPTPPDQPKEWLSVWANLRQISLDSPRPIGRASGGAEGATIVESSVTLLRLLERAAQSRRLPGEAHASAVEDAVHGPLALHVAAMWEDVARALPSTPEGVTRWADIQLVAEASLRWATRLTAAPAWWDAFGSAVLTVLEAVAEAPHQVERLRWSSSSEEPWPAVLLSHWLEMDAGWSLTTGDVRRGAMPNPWAQVRRLALPPLLSGLPVEPVEVEWGLRFLTGCPQVLREAWPPVVWKRLLLSSRREVRLWAMAHHPAALQGTVLGTTEDFSATT